jgi:hypothetical protein
LEKRKANRRKLENESRRPKNAAIKVSERKGEHGGENIFRTKGHRF